MKRNADTMDEKDWIILSLARLIANTARNGTTPTEMLNHPDYDNTCLWVANELDIFAGGPTDPISVLEATEPRPFVKHPAKVQIVEGGATWLVGQPIMGLDHHTRATPKATTS